jgi:hypothetical protein
MLSDRGCHFWRRGPRTPRTVPVPPSRSTIAPRPPFDRPEATLSSNAYELREQSLAKRRLSRHRVLPYLPSIGGPGLIARSPTFENNAAGLIQHQDQIGSTERAGLGQFERKGLGLKHGDLRTREAASAFVRKRFRSVKDMEKVAHRLSIIRHVGNSSENHVMNVRVVISANFGCEPCASGPIAA